MFSSPDSLVVITTGVIKSRPYSPNGRLLQITRQDQSLVVKYALQAPIAIEIYLQLV